VPICFCSMCSLIVPSISSPQKIHLVMLHT
jgi:hypothetical protein